MNINMLLNQINLTMQVPLSLVDSDYNTIHCAPLIEHHILPDKLIQAEIEYWNSLMIPMYMPSFREASFSALIGTIRIDEDTYLIVGPTASEGINITDVINSFSGIINRKELYNLYRIYTKSSIMDSIQFANILSLIAFIIHHRQIKPSQIIGEGLPIESRPIIMADDSMDFYRLIRRNNQITTDTLFVQQCIQYINDHIGEKITSENFARFCYLDRSIFFRKFREEFHTTPSAYILSERLRRAQMMLRQSNYSIAEIASSLGFNSQSYFTKVYSKHFGHTPRSFRKKGL